MEWFKNWSEKRKDENQKKHYENQKKRVEDLRRNVVALRSAAADYEKKADAAARELYKMERDLPLP